MIKKLIGLILFAVLLTGCCSPRYNDNYPPSYVRVKHIVEGEHTSNFYKTFWDTIWTPKGDQWLQQKDLKWLKKDPEANDWNNHFKKALLLHENAHCINDQNLEHLKHIACNYQWITEREGYQVQMRYLILKGLIFDKERKIAYLKAMTDPTYNGMVRRQEAWAFINETVRNAEAEKKRKGIILAIEGKMDLTEKVLAIHLAVEKTITEKQEKK